MKKMYCVITTVQPPTESVLELLRRVEGVNGTIVVVGDRKGPEKYNCEGLHSGKSVRFFAFADQPGLPFRLPAKLPVGHYARKNIGYLLAIAEHASVIYETDDDNMPMSHWGVRRQEVDNCRVVPVQLTENGRPGGEWYNVYQNFSDEFIWPRGFPLERVPQAVIPTEQLIQKSCSSPVHQGLVNGSPDVDAIWRMVFDRDFDFSCRRDLSIHLLPGNWCPFNTQNTWFWPEVYPLLYIPSHCSFRMCDIWKSFIAQRCLWEIDKGVIFHAPDVVQKRNFHNMRQDFKDEIPGYLKNMEIAKLLEAISFTGRNDMGNLLYGCYETLVRAGIFPKKEMPLVECWLQDLENIAGCR